LGITEAGVRYNDKEKGERKDTNATFETVGWGRKQEKKTYRTLMPEGRDNSKTTAKEIKEAALRKKPRKN